MWAGGDGTPPCPNDRNDAPKRLPLSPPQSDVPHCGTAPAPQDSPYEGVLGGIIPPKRSTVALPLDSATMAGGVPERVVTLLTMEYTPVPSAEAARAEIIGSARRQPRRPDSCQTRCDSNSPEQRKASPGPCSSP